MVLNQALFADVYELCGVSGREGQVELAFGSASKAQNIWPRIYDNDVALIVV